jgi:hypothetical protein
MIEVCEASKRKMYGTTQIDIKRKLEWSSGRFGLQLTST